LLVNDEEFLLHGFKQQLQPYFEVFEATNGLQALNIVISRPVDFFAAILLDINMPIMSGYDACDRMHDYLHKS